MNSLILDFICIQIKSAFSFWMVEVPNVIMCCYDIVQAFVQPPFLYVIVYYGNNSNLLFNYTV